MGARKPVPALPCSRVPVSLITNATEPRSVVVVPKTLLSSTRKPPVTNSRSKKRSCCSRKTDSVSVAARKTPLFSPSSRRYSSPTLLVLHFPMKNELTHSASFRTTSTWEKIGKSKSTPGSTGSWKPELFS